MEFDGDLMIYKDKVEFDISKNVNFEEVMKALFKEAGKEEILEKTYAGTLLKIHAKKILSNTFDGGETVDW